MGILLYWFTKKKRPHAAAFFKENHCSLEVEPEFRRICSWSHEVCPTKRRQKVVERRLICQVNNGKPQAPLIVIAVKEVVIADGSVKQMPRRDARWIMVDVECPEFREGYSGCATGW